MKKLAFGTGEFDTLVCAKIVVYLVANLITLLTTYLLFQAFQPKY